MSRRWVVVSLGSPLIAAPTGELGRTWSLRGASYRCWEHKRISGFMEFGVMDDRTGLVVWTTDDSHVGRSEDERRLRRAPSPEGAAGGGER